MSREAIVILVLLPLSSTVWAQIIDCPQGWVTYSDHCYNFVFYPTATYDQAAAACEQDGAYLVSINSEAEFDFISQWLTRSELDRSRRWWTSGIGAGQALHFEGDGSDPVLDMSNKWGETGVGDKGSLSIVYAFTTVTNTFLWTRQQASESSPYVCEVSLSQSFQVHQAQRDFSYGTIYQDPLSVPRGPRFMVLPQPVVVVGQQDSIYLECVADSNPPSSYTWYRQTPTSVTRITPETDNRYSLTNGRFSFQNPQEVKDAGMYFCVAENQFGSIRTHAVRVSFGYIGEFSNDPPGAVRANLYQGTVITCNPPRYNPAASFQWFKGPGVNFVRPEMNTYQFISQNGRLYFSETQLSDAGMYHCVITLTAPLGQSMATLQPPSKTSLGIELIIRGDTATDFGPTIHNDFPAVFPTPALRGEQVRIECFAYGRLPLYYTWTRSNGPIPEKVQFLDEGRVLLIPDAQLEDSGNYTCRVQQGSRSFDNNTIAVVIEAAPFFMFPLRDQHVDVSSEVTLRCYAGGVPRPVYSWFKNTQPLTSEPGDVEVIGNVVTIKKADASRHNGMYACQAANLYGTRVSTAQIRVLSFAPTFSKRPVDDSQTATVGGNTTILCQPEASPAPEITWSHNNQALNLVRGALGRIMMLDNGNLIITQIQTSDQGQYTCTAENIEGKASSSGLLTVVSRATITLPPHDTSVEVNSTAFLQCQASYNQRFVDLVYSWTFNGVEIDTVNDPTFENSLQENQPGLYIINTQFEHDGVYQCRALTVDDTVVASAYLTVQGPPSEPAGLFGQVTGDSSVMLSWSVGDSHGADILFFNIEYMTNFNPIWRYKYTQLRSADVIDKEHSDKRTFEITDLSPGSSYSFRVSAVNRFGTGPPSQPSPYFKIPDAAPSKAPEQISEMYGSVGTLAFTWTELNPEDLTGNNIGYKAFWRKKTGGDGRWEKEIISGHKNSHVALVGVENFYLEYDVKVGAFNNLGDGPNSTIFTVMSAEDIPLATPRNVWGQDYNSTAIHVFWDAVDNSREAMRGKLRGFRILCWYDGRPSVQYWSYLWCEDCTEGIFIGLSPDSALWVNVQVFNSAGFGPKGEDAYMTTFIYPIKRYPEYVQVASHGPNSVYVEWRGVASGKHEEALDGYKLRWWPATEDIHGAQDTVIRTTRNTWGVIEGVKTGVVYALRVVPFSRAGDGAKSPTVFFTLEGMIVYNPETTDIVAASCHVTFSLWTVAITCFMCWLLS